MRHNRVGDQFIVTRETGPTENYRSAPLDAKVVVDMEGQNVFYSDEQDCADYLGRLADSKYGEDIRHGYFEKKELTDEGLQTLAENVEDDTGQLLEADSNGFEEQWQRIQAAARMDRNDNGF